MSETGNPETVVRRPIRRAILSVYDKTGLTELARGLAEHGVELVSTGSTAATIEQAGLAVTRVEDVTGFTECLDGRVKTLHPSIHAGLLADLRRAEHSRELETLGVAPFDLLVSNLYPFTETVASGATPDEIVEQIDIGGPAMVRSAAKNHASVAVVVSPARYSDLLSAMAAGGFTVEQRRRLAGEAYAHIADYDVAIANWFASSYATVDDSNFPDFIGSTLRRMHDLRYGENPHQGAALYSTMGGPVGLAQAEQLHGKGMSYNNYVDADSARRAVYAFEAPCVAIIKHMNPCGIAVGVDIADAHAKAHACDPLSAYGGVIAANRPVSAAMATAVAPVLTEIVVAPDFEPEALEILTRKKNIRLLRCPPPSPADAASGLDSGIGEGVYDLKYITGGLLAQGIDRVDATGDDPANWKLVAGSPVSVEVLDDLLFAWRAARWVRSNAIVLASGGATVGVGMGQVNRVDSARLAVSRAGDRAGGSVGASDAFFPFADGLQILIEGGVRAIVEPGGSVRDDEVIAAANDAGVPLYFTGSRHFFH